MRIDLIPFLSAISDKDMTGYTAIVIDVLRATSTIVTALENEAKSIIPVEQPIEALNMASDFPEYLIAGEREGIKLKGFDLGNSPLEFTNPRIKDKVIVHCTTNGTKTILMCRQAKNLLIGSLLNRAACLDYAVTLGNDIILICAGRKNGPAKEDSIVAGTFVEYLRRTHQCSASKLAMESYYLYKNIGMNLYDAIYKSPSGQNLIGMGLKTDIDFCLRKDIYNVVPVYNDDAIRAK